ncbi:MAG: hypothetical protein ACR2L2_15280 [Acidobacteriota bacterium]
MADAGVIDTAVRDAALPVRLKLPTQSSQNQAVSFVERKAATAVRGRLSNVLDVPRAYDLNRLDLTAGATLDGDIHHAATRLLRSLRNPAEKDRKSNHTNPSISGLVVLVRRRSSAGDPPSTLC